MAVSVGVDVGGTFTDFALTSHERDLTRKLLTTPDDPSVAMFEGLEQILADAGVGWDEVDRIVHGTTLVSNTLIQRRGARTGLLTTAGFRDLLEIGRGFRYDNYDLQLEFPDPLVPRHLRLEVRERLAGDGTVITRLDEGEVAEAAARFSAAGIESLAICFLHAYRDGIHEQRARDIVREVAPDLPISVSSEVVPEIGEFERLVTTVADAYVRPVMDRYLERLEVGLRERGFRGHLFVMRSDRGLTTVENARRFPIHHLESGPAAGATAAGSLAESLGFSRVIAFDMGGTTAKAAFVDDGRPAETYGYEVARVHLFKAGSGLFLRSPAVEQVEVGAGGGSIAHRNALGALAVGPESAGSMPGPAAYARGGEAPTVTDANLLLGFLDPVTFANGVIPLDTCRATAAIGGLAAEFGIDPDDLARGIRNLADESMAHAFNTHCAEKGIDPRGRVLISFGGGGPLHADAIARRMGVRTIVVPPAASVFSAVGLLLAPLTFVHSRTHRLPLAGITAVHVEEVVGPLRERVRRQLLESGVPGDEIRVELSAEMRYSGQRHLVTVKLGDLPDDDAALAASLRRWFLEEYKSQYGHPGLAQPIEVVTWRVRCSSTPSVRPWRAAVGTTASDPALPPRTVRINGSGPNPARTVRRSSLVPGEVVDGPALIDEGDAVTYVGPDARAVVHELGSLVITLGGGGRR